MSIASEFQSTAENIQADYEGLENIGADLTGINKNILNIRTILDNIYNDLPKVSDTGTEVTLTPTRKGRLALIPKGNSIQESTTGKNILPAINLTSQSVHGVVFTPHYTNGLLDYVDVDGTWEGTGTNAHYDLGSVSFTGNESYSISGINGYETNYINLWTTSSIAFPQGNRLSTANGVVTRTALGNETCNISIYIYSGKSYDHLKVYPMICRNNTSDTYEPYTNGQAPNPSYPFPIKSVTGNNNVVVKGKNLLNYKGITPVNNKTTITEIPNGIKVINASDGYAGKIEFSNLDKNTNYTLSFNKEVISGTGSAVRIFRDNTSTNIQTITGNSGVFTTGDYQDKILIWFYASSGTVAEVNFTNIQLEKGSTATTYEPYVTPQTKPLNLGTIELNKIGNYQDYIFKQNDKWYKHEEIKKKILTGEENWSIYFSTNGVYLCVDSDIVGNQTSNINGICNKFVCVNRSAIRDNLATVDNCITCNRNELVIAYKTEQTTTSFKTWLSNNNVVVYYKRYSATDIEITDTQLIEQLNEIEKMKSYNGTTIITSTNEGTCDIIIEASALKNAE